VAADTRHLIRDLSQANPLWGAPRIHGELLKLGIEVAQSTVAKYLRRARKPPSQTWRTFLTNHLEQMASLDFFVVPTATFRVLFVFVVLSHARRRVLHFQVTDHPSQDWTMQQIREAFPWDQGCRYPRDRDGIYRDDWVEMTKGLGIEEVIAAPRSPWQNPFVERLIGSVRRECLDHIIVWNARSLRRTLRSYFAYYQDFRTHLALAKDAPESRAETGFFSALHALRFSTPLHRCCTGTSISFSSRELSACRRDFRAFSSEGVFDNHSNSRSLFRGAKQDSVTLLRASNHGQPLAVR
jgi:transposase InsO family protein